MEAVTSGSLIYNVSYWSLVTIVVFLFIQFFAYGIDKFNEAGMKFTGGWHGAVKPAIVCAVVFITGTMAVDALVGYLAFNNIPFMGHEHCLR